MIQWLMVSMRLYSTYLSANRRINDVNSDNSGNDDYTSDGNSNSTSNNSNDSNSSCSERLSTFDCEYSTPLSTFEYVWVYLWVHLNKNFFDYLRELQNFLE
jgi:hypothetical protein